jgi:hypothetical protein
VSAWAVNQLVRKCRPVPRLVPETLSTACSSKKRLCSAALTLMVAIVRLLAG